MLGTYRLIAIKFIFDSANTFDLERNGGFAEEQMKHQQIYDALYLIKSTFLSRTQMYKAVYMYSTAT